MATVELDPQFVKALRLLRSKSKDSGAQLRAMLEDAIRQRKGLAPAPRSPNVKGGVRGVSSERSLEREKKKDLDRLKKDLSELVDKPSDPKRARLESPGRSSTSLSHSPSPSSNSPPGEISGEGSAGSEGEFGDLQMNLEFTDCSCCVCKTFTQESSNKLMECSSCQNLYHQECHSPPVSSQEASDPRLIWNCYKCTKKCSKDKDKEGSSGSSKPRSDKSSSSGSKGSSGSSSKRSSSSSSRHKTDSGHGSSKSGSSSSKSKSSSSGSSGGSGSLGGGSSGSSTSGASSGGELSSSAKKRLKLLKKQAAAATNISKKTKK